MTRIKKTPATATATTTTRAKAVKKELSREELINIIKLSLK